MSAMVRPKLGFKSSETPLDGKLAERASNIARDAARRKFTPEFINRMDKMVVFKALGEAELRRVLDLELRVVAERISRAIGPRSLLFDVSEPAKDCLLREGTDLRYGARHLKRAVERMLIQPLSNLLATGQIQDGDSIAIDCADGSNTLVFFKQSGSHSDRKAAMRAGGSLAA